MEELTRLEPGPGLEPEPELEQHENKRSLVFEAVWRSPVLLELPTLAVIARSSDQGWAWRSAEGLCLSSLLSRGDVDRALENVQAEFHWGYSGVELQRVSSRSEEERLGIRKWHKDGVLAEAACEPQAALPWE